MVPNQSVPVHRVRVGFSVFPFERLPAPFPREWKFSLQLLLYPIKDESFSRTGDLDVGGGTSPLSPPTSDGVH